ncbi:MAG: LPS export ABC transporter periplasmic protein LptC [Chitinophagaceae bacterium]|nr:LPS export ABC transporter periplasmic protein LptC [Chitinophagaceae bacterium]
MRNRNNYIFLLSLFVCLSCTFLASCENDEKVLQERAKRKMGVDEAKKIELLYSQSGKVRSRLTAPVMLRYQDTLPRVEFPNSLHIDFFDSTLQVENIVDSKYGRYIEGQNRAFLRDSVVAIQLTKMDTVRCQELWWDQNKQLFYTDKPATVTKKDGTIIHAAKGLKASQDFKKIEFFETLDGTLVVSNAEFSGLSASQDSSADNKTDSVKVEKKPEQ